MPAAACEAGRLYDFRHTLGRDLAEVVQLHCHALHLADPAFEVGLLVEQRELTTLCNSGCD